MHLPTNHVRLAYYPLRIEPERYYCTTKKKKLKNIESGRHHQDKMQSSYLPYRKDLILNDMASPHVLAGSTTIL
jgi:hypothetical protein